MNDREATEIYARLSTCTLPKPEWTHEAHLAACWAALRELRVETALDVLRDTICVYNTATGVENTATSGYHETITRYYVGAVASLGDRPVREIVDAKRCARAAPFTFWTTERLFSEPARAAWIAPDLRPLPWETPGPT